MFNILRKAKFKKISHFSFQFLEQFDESLNIPAKIIHILFLDKFVWIINCWIYKTMGIDFCEYLFNLFYLSVIGVGKIRRKYSSTWRVSDSSTQVNAFHNLVYSDLITQLVFERKPLIRKLKRLKIIRYMRPSL